MSANDGLHFELVTAPEAAARASAEAFGLHVFDAIRLHGEANESFAVTADDGDCYVLKIRNGNAAAQLENPVLSYLAPQELHVDIPHVMTTPDGEDVVT